MALIECLFLFLKGIEGLTAQKDRIYEIYICMSCRSAHKTSQKIGFMSRSIRFGNTNIRKGRLKYVF